MPSMKHAPAQKQGEHAFTSTEWRDRAACLDQDPELFFPIANPARGTTPEIEEAKAVCRRCPVQPDCLAWALATEQRDGVWGGLSERELDKALREQRRTRAAAAAAAGLPAPRRAKVTGVQGQRRPAAAGRAS